MRRNSPPTLDSSPAPAQGLVLQWLGGILIPVGLLIYGYVCVHTSHISIFGSAGMDVVNHTAAFWMAIACMALAAFLHFQFHWTTKTRLRAFSHTFKIAALVVFVPSFCYSLYRTFDVL
jgi:ABC-type enterochelin transport system permease subunit